MRIWYYTRNGRQFGPTGIEQLLQMLGTGGLDPEDLVWREGMEEWLPASEMPELTTQPPPLERALQRYQTDTAREAAAARANARQENGDILPGAQPLLAGPCMAHGLRMMLVNLKPLLIAGLLWFALIYGAYVLGDRIDQWRGYQAPEVTLFPPDQAENNRVLKELFYSQSLPVKIGGALVECFLTLGMARMALNAVLRKKVDPLMLFGEFRVFPKYLVANLLYTLMVGMGLIFFIAPGIYLAAVFGQYRYAILERNMGIFEAFQHSFEISRFSVLQLLSLTVFCAVTLFTGMMLTGVGLIFAMPLVAAIQAAAWQWLTRGAEAAFSPLKEEEEGR